MATIACWEPQTAESIKRYFEERLEATPGFENIIGASPAMLDVFEQTRRAAHASSTVLVTGESGTGKELIADAIRRHSSRSKAPFVTVNIAAVPETLVESELFGHAKGAFTGAVTNRIGRFEAAHGGTLFIDEIGDLAIPCQAKLLRVLETRRISPVGDNLEREVDVRVVAATSRNLDEMVQSGDFREDLYYRLNVVVIRLPPLHERRGDILPLVRYFLGRLTEENGRGAFKLDRELLRFLEMYDWPGNVRQLRNCIESMVVLSASDTLAMADLPCTVQRRRAAARPALDFLHGRTLEDIERMVIVEALDRHQGNRQHTAESLGISVRTLQRKLKKWEAGN